jgi:enoyl-[acyl-carrier protein] reductase I
MDFSGKKVLLLGVANERSIAWSIAQALHTRGASLCLTYANESIERRLRPLAESIGCSHVFPCDVQSDEEVRHLRDELSEKWSSVDSIVHAVAYAEREDLQGKFFQTSRKGFHTALDVSAYSLISLCGEFQPLMAERGGSVLTLTYLGSQRVVENYKVMGVAKAALEASVRYLAAELGEHSIRVNALSPGPIKTLAASGIPKFKDLLSEFAERAPLRRNVSTDDVASAALFYLSNLAAGITGEITYVDCGFNVLGL